MMKLDLIFGLSLVLPMILSAESVSWKGSVSGVWDDPANWSLEAVPSEESDVTIDKTDTTVSVTAAAAAKSVSLKKQHADMSIAADLSVSGGFVVGAASGTANAVDHSAGAVTVGGTLTLGNGNGNTASWDAHGEGASLTAAGVYAVRYRGAASSGLIVRDGATATVSGTIDLGHEGANGNTPPGTAYLKVLDGSSVTVGTLNFSNSGYGVVDISNATLTVTTKIMANGSAAPALGLAYSTLNVWDGGVVTTPLIAFSQYTAWHEQMVQWPGSKVTTASMKLSGEGQGGTGSAGDIRYVINGGILQVNGTVLTGCNGQAEFLAHGGTTEVTGSFCVDNLRDVKNADGTIKTYYNPSKLSLGGSAVFNVLNGTLQMNARDTNRNVRGGRVALELIGGNFDATVKNLEWMKVTTEPDQSIIARLDATGLAPLKVTVDVIFNTPLRVVPSATKDAEVGVYPILTWGGTLTGAANVSLDENAGTGWKLTVDETNKRMLLRYTKPGLLVIVR